MTRFVSVLGSVHAPRIMRTPVLLLLAAALVIIMEAGCNRSAVEPVSAASLGLASSSLPAESIPSKYTCDGANTSPELSWKAPPARTQSFALLVTDKDASLGFGRGNFVHWLLYDLPAGKRELSEGVPKQEQLPDGSRQGVNNFNQTGYDGPCPPGGSPHHYVFVLYALDSKLNLPSGATEDQVLKAMRGHVLATGQIAAGYQRTSSH
jgi:Raf kinase inhibitor-like YbhB/YbcL family protein